MNPTNINTFTKNRTDELLKKLDETDGMPQSPYVAYREWAEIFRTAMSEVKEKLMSYAFPDDEEEIQFFKETLLTLLCLWIFTAEMFDYKFALAESGANQAEEIRERLFKRIQDFVRVNRNLIIYYESDETVMDRYYYLKNSSWNQKPAGMDDDDLEQSVHTRSSLIVATWLAYRLITQRVLIVPSHADYHSSMSFSERLSWSESKAALTEVIYSLRECGAVNNGKATLKQLTACFEYMFSIKLGNITKSFQDIKNRKSDKPLFLDKAKAALKKAIDREVRDDN